jgi:molybdopterin-guanine dinucleotide biosynthesis protein A
MIDAPQMLLLGSGGRDAGEAVFACSLVRKASLRRPLTAATVTSVRVRVGNGSAGFEPRHPAYVITEERCASEDSNTSRLLASGAQSVWHLRVREDRLEEGAQALFDAMGASGPVVCLSNSLRTVVDPALFLMFRRQEAKALTASAQRVTQYADRNVVCNDICFNLALDDLGFAQGIWTLREEATAIILAGGNSTRMSQDKSRLCIQDLPLIEHICLRLAPNFRQILISSRHAHDFTYPDIAVVPDRVPGMGPLVGIASALEASRYDRNFVVACDMPDFDMRGVRAMLRAAKGCDIAAAVAGEGPAEPLFAAWRKSAAPAIEETLRVGERSAWKVFARCAVKRVPISPKQLGHNLNTPQDYEDFVSQQTRSQKSP